eukprot:g14441.t1
MREAIVLDLGDIGAQAARIRAAAESEAAKIVSNAKQKAEELADSLYSEAEKLGFDQGHENGLAEGREQGHAEALAQSSEQLRQLSAAWSQVASDWEQQRTEMEREARQAVLDFALSAAEKIVHRVIEVDESVVIDQVAQALSLVLSAHDASVSIHPVDRPMLEDALPDLLKELSTLKHITLGDDESITPGGCIVTFGQGRVDATIERQLQRLIDLILPAPEPLPDAEPTAQEAKAVTQPEPIAPVDLQGVADAAAQEVAESLIEPVGKPPVYEITDQGLVQTQGEQAELADQDDLEQADDTPEPQGPGTPESEA